MIPYLLADNPQMTKEQAFAESKRMMQGQKWKAFVLDLSFIGWYILSGLTLGILAIFYVSPYVNATHAALYEATVLCKPGWFKRIYTAGGSGEFTFPAGECMNYTILIADDEPEIRTLLRLYLEMKIIRLLRRKREAGTGTAKERTCGSVSAGYYDAGDGRIPCVAGIT